MRPSRRSGVTEGGLAGTLSCDFSHGPEASLEASGAEAVPARPSAGQRGWGSFLLCVGASRSLLFLLGDRMTF